MEVNLKNIRSFGVRLLIDSRNGEFLFGELLDELEMKD